MYFDLIVLLYWCKRHFCNHADQGGHKATVI